MTNSILRTAIGSSDSYKQLRTRIDVPFGLATTTEGSVSSTFSIEGRIFYDTTTQTIKLRTASGWTSIGSGGGGGVSGSGTTPNIAVWVNSTTLGNPASVSSNSIDVPTAGGSAFQFLKSGARDGIFHLPFAGPSGPIEGDVYHATSDGHLYYKNFSNLVRLDFDTNATGASGAATLGQVGGSGPTTTTQNIWLKTQVGGVTYWVPAWV